MALNPNTQARVSPLAGKPAPKDMLVIWPQLERDYYERQPNLNDPNQLVSLRHQRTSGHRRCEAPSPKRTFWPSPRRFASIAENKAPTARCTWAKTRTRCQSRRSAPRLKFWPPTKSRRSSSATMDSRRRRSFRMRSSSTTAAGRTHLADGIVITPSHNPPEDGGFKYNPPNGGPADTDVTSGSKTAPMSC